MAFLLDKNCLFIVAFAQGVPYIYTERVRQRSMLASALASAHAWILGGSVPLCVGWFKNPVLKPPLIHYSRPISTFPLSPTECKR